MAALALVAEIVHGTPARFTDPARFSLAHGGKDGHPFPVPLKVYDETIRVLKDAVSRMPELRRVAGACPCSKSVRWVAENGKSAVVADPAR